MDCKNCVGTGEVKPKCEVCNGKGNTIYGQRCYKCKGIPEACKPCPKCNGTGEIASNEMEKNFKDKVLNVIEKSFRNTQIKTTCDNICDDCMRQSPIVASTEILLEIKKVGDEYINKISVEANKHTGGIYQNFMAQIKGVKKFMSMLGI